MEEQIESEGYDLWPHEGGISGSISWTFFGMSGIPTRTPQPGQETSNLVVKADITIADILRERYEHPESEAWYAHFGFPAFAVG